MLGPLPRRYRWTLGAGVLAVFVVLGLVAGAASTVPLLLPSAVTLAVPLGLGAAYLLLHDFSARARL
ncbi:OapA N-terminal domain-containing protein [Nocardioides zeae]|uniref:OapA N-terminal domain-containing protein n=1 Tax=Nocardioides imazamoxiresistens TaxID=3231893 RepID=A0ABU3PX73_9ACTN|nr:OapA N-terminal domain-containing protein [Nocardioides zeae]MDT9593828.1 OapA N-terminal domain-containing protein [Nocardioides zeae]